MYTVSIYPIRPFRSLYFTIAGICKSIYNGGIIYGKRTKNDLSFLIKNELNLFEHQSTYSPNLPLRGFLYFADLYRKIIGNKRDIYSSKLIELPLPQFIIFYNGTTEEPERKVISLSKSFVKTRKDCRPCLECTAVMLNINLGSNPALMEKCHKLHEYAQFIAKVRENSKTELTIQLALDKAVTECIRENILKDILLKNREGVVNMLLTEYDEEFHIKCEREIALEEGLERGIRAFIVDYEEEGFSKERIMEKIQKRFDTTREAAEQYFEKYSQKQ